MCESKVLACSVSGDISVVYQGIMKGIVNGIIMFSLARQRSFTVTNTTSKNSRDFQM